MEREDALQRLADRDQVLNRTIEEQYITARDRLFAMRSQIEAQQNQIASINAKGKKAKSLIGDAMQSISVGMDQINGALEALARQRSDALAQLATQVRDLSNQIESQTQSSYAQIEIENQKARA